MYIEIFAYVFMYIYLCIFKRTINFTIRRKPKSCHADRQPLVKCTTTSTSIHEALTAHKIQSLGRNSFIQIHLLQLRTYLVTAAGKPTHTNLY